MRLTTGEKIAIALALWYWYQSARRARVVDALQDLSQDILPAGYRINVVTGRVEKLVDGVWRDHP